MRIKFYFLSFSALLFLTTLPTIFIEAQPQPTPTERLVADANINPNANGYWEYLPQGYDPTGSTLFPLLIYIPGIAQSGNGNTELSRLYDFGDGPPYWVHQNINNLSSFTVGATTYRFIMFAPQWVRAITDTTKYPTLEEINSVINYAIERYKVDRSRIYLMGISTGAGSVWHYVTASNFNASRFAAIVPFSGTETPTHAKAQILKDNHMPIWAFHNSADAGVPVFFTQAWQTVITEVGGYAPAPRITIFPTTDPGNHTSWGGPTEGTYTEAAGLGGQTMNVYQWMLQFTRTPPAAQAPVANAGVDRNIIAPNNSLQLQGSGTDPDSYTLTYSWSQMSGPNTATISNGTTKNPTIGNLAVGTYVFRLTVTDGNSLQNSDNVNVVVQPAGSLTSIESENFSAKNGTVQVFNDPTVSGGQYIGNTSAGDWVDYPINTLGGQFNFNFRAVAAFGASFTVSAGGNLLATVNIPAFFDWGHWSTVGPVLITLPAGPQTLRLSGPGNWAMDNFTFAASGTLPVKYVYFNSQCEGSAVNLKWKTSQEVNVLRYAVQRSADGRSWSEIGSVAAAGHSTQERTYVFQDKGASSNSLYRIVEYDYSGQTTISSVVRGGCSLRNDVSLYPNPASSQSAVNITLERSTKVVLHILDSKGALVGQNEMVLPAGTNSIPLNVSNYAKGIYTVQVNYNGEVKTLKLIKK